ncbi:MAG TPA: L,D-transpeptidase family protein [Allosphingosinicella sp.]
MRSIFWLSFVLLLAGCGNGQPAAPDGKAPAAGEGLRAAVSGPLATRFYEGRQWRTAWTPETEAALTAAINDAARHGLEGNDFLAPIGRARTPAARDAALTLAALTYAGALARGRTDPAGLSEHYSVPRPDPDLAAGLNRALAENGLGDWLAGLAPQDAEYRALSDAYLATGRAATVAPGRPATAANRAALEQARTLAVNLERRRWLERTPPATRIDVNTGAATMTYWRDGAAVDSRRAVVGEPGKETPELASPLYRLVANPTWTIPRSIQNGELASKSAAYLRRNNMEMRDGWLVQKSGPRNSLGLVKFDMLNDQQIYLHDTPAKALFGQDDRHASHGCVRIDDALGFAQMIATDQGVLDQWREALATNEEAMVPLPRRIPVRLMYQTAFLANGRITFVPDAYGWDDKVAEALGLPSRPRSAAARRRAGDLGP